MSGFGEFVTICKNSATIPVCTLFTDRADKTCQLVGVDFGALRILDLGDVLACFLCMLVALRIAYKTHSKFAAVGRAEMNILTFFYLLTLVAQIISVGGWVTTEQDQFQYIQWWSTIIHVGLITSTFWVLLLNGFVGFQFMEDGTPISIYGMFISALVIAVGTSYIAGDTLFSWTNAFKPGVTLKSIPLFILIFVLPALFAVLYIVSQAILVVSNLSQRKPLLWLLVSLVLFALSQAFTFYFSNSICKGTLGYVDGKLFSTILNLGSYVSVFKYWSSIIEDEWEDFEDHF